MSAFTGAEARHGHRQDMLRRKAHELGGPMADQQGQGGVQSAGDAHHRPVDAGVGEAGSQRMALQFKPLPEGTALGLRLHGQVGGGGEAAQRIVVGHSREAEGGRGKPSRCGAAAADDVQVDVVAEGGGLAELRLNAHRFTGFGNDGKAPVAEWVRAVRPGAAAEDGGTAQLPAQDAEGLFRPIGTAHPGRLVAGQQQAVTVPGKGAVPQGLAGIAAGQHPQPGAAGLKGGGGRQEPLGKRPLRHRGRQHITQHGPLADSCHGGNGHPAQRNRQPHKQK